MGVKELYSCALFIDRWKVRYQAAATSRGKAGCSALSFFPLLVASFGRDRKLLRSPHLLVFPRAALEGSVRRNRKRNLFQCQQLKSELMPPQGFGSKAMVSRER